MFKYGTSARPYSDVNEGNKEKLKLPSVNNCPETSSWLSSPVDWFQRKSNVDHRRKSIGFGDYPKRRGAEELDASLWDDLTMDSSISPFTPTSPSKILVKAENATSSLPKPKVLELSLESIQHDISISDNIMAPMVDKLPQSALVEVVIQSETERVSVICSSDILKMKSPFFFSILSDQEQSRDYDSRNLMVHEIWRPRIILDEVSPYEAVALLEGLHENSLGYIIAWNYSFCRLSALWLLNDHLRVFAEIIDEHFNKLISIVKCHSWRSNPNVFTGMNLYSLTFDRKHPPLVISGVVVDSNGHISFPHVCCKQLVSIYTDNSDGDSTVFSESPSSRKFAPLQNALAQPSILSPRSRSAAIFQSDQFISPHDVTVVQEPFWVQDSVYNSPWMTADDASKLLIDSRISLLDKRKFWEMLKLVQQIDSLNSFCRNRLKTASLIADTIGRVEFGSLWSSEAPECLTQEALFALLSRKFSKE